MHIAGHIGFTLAGATVIQQLRKRPALGLRTLSLYATCSLLPDVLDRAIHMLDSNCPDHFIFHSIPLYGLALFIVWKSYPRCFAPLLVMAFHPVLDLMNSDPSSLIFPLYGWVDWEPSFQGLGYYIMRPLPRFLHGTFAGGHYWFLELIGLLLAVWSLWKSLKAGKHGVNQPRGWQEPCKCAESKI